MPDLLLRSAPEDAVARLTLHRPERKNALSIALRDEISDALSALAANPEVKIVVLTGSGDTFCAGFDLKEFERASDPEFSRRLWASSDRYHRACLEFPLPLVAAVNGPAIAGGFDLAVMCDLRIAVPETYFSHPEIAFGDVLYSPLHDLAGAAVARDLCLTGRRVDAEEARELRLVSRVVPRAELDDEVARWTAMIARAPREVLLRTKAKAIARARISANGTLDL
ncbi:MAG TPA: enoyl-CoA hydratase/isomerase family protein [Myxococcota bacterium]|nr:enoyl-CoA hydratase/isomerase family protein [Myxococcota bacterium]